MEKKFFKDYGVEVIHLQNKYSVKELDDVLKELNWYFYRFSYLYAGRKAAEFLMKIIEEAGIKIKNITWPMSKGTGTNSRKEELLTKLRDIYKSIKFITDDDKELEEKVSKMQIAKYLKVKNELTIDDKLEWIKWLFIFSKAYTPNQKLIELQSEILKQFVLWEGVQWQDQ